MNAVFGSILENLRAIEIVEVPTVDAFKNDRTNTGDSKELTVSQFVERYLPADFKVKRGIIYSQQGYSNNIDCVVLAPNHPALATPIREVILAEGVYSAIEVKPDISVLTEKGELLRGLNQIKSIKSLSRQIEQVDLSKLLNTSPKPNYYSKIPCAIFSHKSTEILKTINFIISKIKDGTLNSEEIPDLIVTLDKGLIMYTPHLSSTGIGQALPKEQRELYGERVFLHFETTEKETTLALFLLMFLNFTPPTMLTSKFIIKDYLAQLKVKYSTKIYAVELNAEKVLEIVMKKIEDENNNGN
jgi:hypothetical protein